MIRNDNGTVQLQTSWPKGQYPLAARVFAVI
jgi:hypothetical protein